MMLGFLLARVGVDVIVLEKHADFFRDSSKLRSAQLQVLSHNNSCATRYVTPFFGTAGNVSPSDISGCC